MTNLITTSQVSELEKYMLLMPQIELEVKHHFSKGVYARELRIPKGTCLTGRIHKFANLNILSSGEMTVSTDGGMVRVKAPFTVVSPPGTKRVAYAHEDCIWTTVHGTDDTDIDQIEQAFTAGDEQDYLEFASQQLLGE